MAKYTGGGDPTKGCFAKREAKDPNDCQFTNDAATVQGLAEDGAWGLSSRIGRLLSQADRRVQLDSFDKTRVK